MTDDELRAEARLCSAQEHTVKPNKARRSWKEARLRAEAELERRGLIL
jgi:hypothetical protein